MPVLERESGERERRGDSRTGAREAGRAPCVVLEREKAEEVRERRERESKKREGNPKGSRSRETRVRVGVIFKFKEGWVGPSPEGPPTLFQNEEGQSPPFQLRGSANAYE